MPVLTVTLLVSTAALASATGVGSSPSAASGSCTRGAVAAVIAGRHVCLKVGQRCKPSNAVDKGTLNTRLRWPKEGEDDGSTGTAADDEGRSVALAGAARRRRGAPLRPEFRAVRH